MVLNVIKSRLELKNPNTIIWAKNITYSKEMIEEFDKQIPKLLEKRLISDSAIQYSAPAFMVIYDIWYVSCVANFWDTKIGNTI